MTYFSLNTLTSAENPIYYTTRSFGKLLFALFVQVIFFIFLYKIRGVHALTDILEKTIMVTALIRV